MGADAYVHVTVETGDVLKGLAEMERRSRQLGPAFRELKKPMRDDQRDHGKRQRGPFGAWARRSPSTLAYYRERGRGRIPRPLGRLLSAIAYSANAYSVTGESRVKWSDVHMTGGAVGHGVRLKARPFMWISTNLLTIAEQVFERTILAAFGGR